MESMASSSAEEKYFDEKNKKEELTNALIYCKKLLQDANLIVDSPPKEISPASIAMGEEFFNSILDMLAERTVITDEDLIAFNETDDEGSFEECKEELDSEISEYIPQPEDEASTFDYIPLSYKQKTVALAEMHPKWNLKTLQRHGCARLKSMQRLHEWKEDVKKGGTTFDKWKQIEMETYEHFIEARASLEQVTTRTLQQWAMASAFSDLSENFTFKASIPWTVRFKRKYRIKQRCITRFVTSRDCATLEETMQAAERFQLQTNAIIPDFDLNYVINTDQTGCQYQMVYNRTLAEQRVKTVLVKKSNLNRMTHSYTAQYSITASGKLLSLVFLCMQESAGKFGPSVEKKVINLMNKFNNVYVTCSKSGKLTKEIYKQDFLKNVILSYVKKNKFLFIIDSWGGQTDAIIYDDIFEDETGKASCTLKIIPPKCTPICQPCDVYFYRQVKNFIKRLQNASTLLKEKREISSREDAIKIHSLVHHQLSAPMFLPMLKYAWYASKLISEKATFLNVNEACFSISILNKPCACKETAFIKCAWCQTILCFTCFYDLYHPQLCISSVNFDEESSDN